MPATDQDIQQLIQCINLEEAEQVKRYSLDQQHTLKSLKAEGLALHPLRVTRKSFGYADYPEIGFRLQFPPENNQFRDGAAIECFCTGQDPVKGILMNLDGLAGDFRLFAPDFPDWIEDEGVGIKLAPDQRTTTIMKTVLNNLEANSRLYGLFREMHGSALPSRGSSEVSSAPVAFSNDRLNQSQQRAVEGILRNQDMLIVHGPPGTGKTTTLIEAILQLVKSGEKVLVCAPSNTAVDHIAKGLLLQGLGVLRVGNPGKVDELIFPHTPEGKQAGSREQKDIKELKIRSEQFRKMATRYKRSFGKAERDQRNLLKKEVRSLRDEIKKLQAYYEEKLFAEAEVILGTPIGLYDAQLKYLKFGTLIIDEAGQCIEPLAWCVFPLATKYVLAGDHLQLPPTVLSQEAAKKGLNKSVLEQSIGNFNHVFLLEVQYRMREAIAGFSSAYFYGGLLQTASYLANTGAHVHFIDTAGSGYSETNGSNGMSLQNEGELKIAQFLVATQQMDPRSTSFISPYAGQVAAARDLLPKPLRVSTIDSYQGQEQDTIILSLVRSNEDNDIGFLKDYRRMNVAITRAKEQLYVIGDSATIGADPFYQAFLLYAERLGAYRTVWDLLPGYEL